MRYMLFAWKKGSPKGGMDDHTKDSHTILELFDGANEELFKEYDWHIYANKTGKTLQMIGDLNDVRNLAKAYDEGMFNANP